MKVYDPANRHTRPLIVILLNAGKEVIRQTVTFNPERENVTDAFQRACYAVLAVRGHFRVRDTIHLLEED